VNPLHFANGPITAVCLAAHPDDVEIAVGGTLLTLAARGSVSGHWLTLSGSPERRAEAGAAAEEFLPGARSTFYDFPDGRLPAYWDEVKDAVHRFAAELPRVDVVFAPRPDDAHQDHRLLGVMAPTVWRDAQVLHYEIPKWDGDMGRPNGYVSIAPELARRKIAALDRHYPSQLSRDWWDEEMFLGLMRIRGMECRTRYAEAFHIGKTILDFGQATVPEADFFDSTDISSASSPKNGHRQPVSTT
jgi:LmbE family N-acetylglucosaminyl deacetylase